MENIISHAHELLTIGWLLALFNIILIDIIMSWDNAIIIWMATKDLKWEQRKKAIMIWIILATILRIFFASMTVYLLSIVWIKFAWWLLLMYVVWKFYKELRNWWKHQEEWHKTKWTLLSAIYLIILADVSMSLDNVLAVAWAADENIVALWIWLVVSIILMAVASNFIANKLEKYPQIQWVWLLVILFVAMWMLLEWWDEIAHWVWFINMVPFIVFIIWALWVFLHNKYIKPVEENIIREWFSKNYMKVITFNIFIIMIMAFFWDVIKSYLFSHYSVLYGFLIVMLFIIVELISLNKFKK